MYKKMKTFSSSISLPILFDCDAQVEYWLNENLLCKFFYVITFHSQVCMYECMHESVYIDKEK